jgi:hypothetical protein
MLSNRSFLVKVVKDEDAKNYTSATDDKRIPDYSKMVDKIGQQVVGAILVYVAADTIRQAIIYTMMTKMK